jgi:hypothetical protein
MVIYRKGHSIAETIKLWLLAPKPQVKFQVTSCGISSERVGLSTEFSSSLLGSLLLINIPLLHHTHLLPLP